MIIIIIISLKFSASPYESDAQLAFLFKEKIVDLVITEDSDLLAYGVSKVFFKMDPSGNGYEIDLSQLSNERLIEIFFSSFHSAREFIFIFEPYKPTFILIKLFLLIN